MPPEIKPTVCERQTAAVAVAKSVALVSIEARLDIRKAAEAFRDEVLEILDYRIAPWHDIASCQPMIDANGKNLLVEVFGWHDIPAENWWKRPTRQTPDQVSPLVAASRYESEPFWCNGDGFRSQIPNRYFKDLGLDNFRKRAGINAAIVVPVHLPLGQIGVVAFPPKDPDHTDLADDFKDYADILALFSRRFISGYVGAMSQEKREAASTNLRPREIECLHWGALGKSNEDIATILSLSPSTVRFHINNAAEKLDAVNRAQTILKAARLGYIKIRSQ